MDKVGEMPGLGSPYLAPGVEAECTTRSRARSGPNLTCLHPRYNHPHSAHHGNLQRHRHNAVVFEWSMDPCHIAVLHTVGAEA